MENKYTIEIGFEELCLIERALELYGRVGMLQFDCLTICNSLQKLIWDKEVSEEFRNQSDMLKSIFDYSKNANPGILNKEIVGDDCRNALHMYQQLRHKRYLDRLKQNPDEDKHIGVDKYPSDVCNLAGMKLPNFKIVENN
jgi:hypothetical protein